GETLPREPRRLGLVTTGALPEDAWGWGRRKADFFSLKGVLEELAAALRLQISFEPGGHPSLHPGRQATLYLGEKEVGWIGEVHPRVLEAFDAPARTCAAELGLDEVVAALGGVPRFRPLPRYPLVMRDLALLVPKDRPAREVDAIIRRV